MQSKEVAIRKRTQIAMANRMMFLWVAGVSVLFGFALVAAIFLTQKLFFNERVLHEKSTTVTTLKANNTNIKLLESQVRVLDTNQSLLNARAVETDKAVQVILDALPSTVNSATFGASIKDKLLAGISGLEVITFLVYPVPGVESLSAESAAQISTSAVSQNQITFLLSIKANVDPNLNLSAADQAAERKRIMSTVLLRFESSIRAIDITNLKIQGQDTLTIQGRGFYEPVRSVDLKYKVVK